MIWTLSQVALGGAIGAAARYLTTVGAIRFVGTGFPVATLVINVLGSCLMGVLVVLLAQKGGMRFAPFLLTGVLGGFTTFSAFSLDAVTLWQRGDGIAAAGYVMGSVVLSIGALMAGMVITRGALA